jgi:hypothetical protein
MRRGIVVLAVAAALAATISFLAPILAEWLYGRNIVANDELAGNYMATIVTIFSAIVSAGAALIAFQVNQEREDAAETVRQDREREADLELQARERRYQQRVSAIVLKANLRPALTAMFEVFAQGRVAMGKEKFKAFMGDNLDYTQVFSEADASTFTELTKAWKATADVPFDITVTDAECVAHMEAETLDHLFKAYNHWAEIRLAAKSSLVEGVTPVRMGAVMHNIEAALNNALHLNDDLNKIVVPNYDSTKVMATDTDAWLAHDDVRLPP